MVPLEERAALGYFAANNAAGETAPNTSSNDPVRTDLGVSLAMELDPLESRTLDHIFSDWEPDWSENDGFQTSSSSTVTETALVSLSSGTSLTDEFTPLVEAILRGQTQNDVSFLFTTEFQVSSNVVSTHSSYLAPELERISQASMPFGEDTVGSAIEEEHLNGPLGSAPPSADIRIIMTIDVFLWADDTDYTYTFIAPDSFRSSKNQAMTFTKAHAGDNYIVAVHPNSAVVNKYEFKTDGKSLCYPKQDGTKINVPQKLLTKERYSHRLENALDGTGSNGNANHI